MDIFVFVLKNRPSALNYSWKNEVIIVIKVENLRLYWLFYNYSCTSPCLVKPKSENRTLLGP